MAAQFALCVGGPWDGHVIPLRGGSQLIVEERPTLRRGAQRFAYRLDRFSSFSGCSYMLWWIYRYGDAMPSEAQLAVFKGTEVGDGP